MITQFLNIDHGTCTSICLQHFQRSLGLALHRGWAKLMPDRCLDLVRYPNQPRPTAAEATDEDGDESQTFIHHSQPPSLAWFLIDD